jgi:hypothetical protein
LAKFATQSGLRRLTGLIARAREGGGELHHYGAGALRRAQITRNSGVFGFPYIID